MAIHRILVAVDASPGSIAALEAAAQLAATLNAELLGVYVEDERLLRGADLPISRVVGSFSGVVRPVERTEIERHLRLQGVRVRQMFETIAAKARIRRSFRVLRGLVATELLAAAGEADLIGLGLRGRSISSRRRIGTTTEAVLKLTGLPVLLLEGGPRTGRAVAVVYDGSGRSRAALDLARQLAPQETTPLIVVLPGTREEAERLHGKAQSEVRSLGIHRSVVFVNTPRTDAAHLARIRPPEGIGLLILPGADAADESFKTLLVELDCPVMVVR